MSKNPSGFVQTRTLDGLDVYSAFSRSDGSNLAVVIGAPSSEINGDLYRFLGWTCGGSLLLLSIGLALAIYQSEQITRAVRALIPPAIALGQGKVQMVPRLHIKELNEVARAFEKSIQIRTSERDEAERGREEAEKATRLKDEFIATVSHELRTPLTSITASLGLLAGASDGHQSATTSRLIAIALSNSQRLSRLVNDILDIEKLQAGKVAFNFRRTNIGAKLEDAIEACRSHSETLGVCVVFHNVDVFEVSADADRLMQVFSNLLSNAIKFSPRDSIVEVDLQDRAGKVRVTFRDHGPGVPPSFKNHLFEKFAQADASDARQRSGTGLGLSIVKEIVDRLGGEVGFADAPGGGALFFVDMPILKPIDAGDCGSILICDDDADAALVISERLQRAGFSVDVSLTASDAMRRASDIDYVTILVDLQLPDSDGITLIQLIRGLPEHATTPIIVVTANPGRGRDDLRSGNLNVFDWIGKPFDQRALLAESEVRLS